MNQYGVKESFKIKTEVLNLELELKCYENDGKFHHNPVLVIKSGDHVHVRLILADMEYEQLKTEFLKKGNPEWNFFDNVLAVVDKSLAANKQ